ncbi:MAG TPA: transcriptional repressor [Anaerolineales bacterium]|nr:transcriptional repressor [Anaerolineales bacterium]
MTSQVEILADTLTAAGHILTPSRRIIIETLVRTGGHITADELAVQVRQESPRVGRMTIYRTLELLTELGLARPIFQGTGAAHYILMAEGDHHHLICSRCHRVIEFDHCASGDLVEILASKFGFSVQNHLLEIHGICRECHV